eukprot:16436503-Heterocapsa_arctica.AAC.1
MVRIQSSRKTSKGIRRADRHSRPDASQRGAAAKPIARSARRACQPRLERLPCGTAQHRSQCGWLRVLALP